MMLTLAVLRRDGLYLRFSNRMDDWSWTTRLTHAAFRTPEFWVKERAQIGRRIKGAELVMFTCTQQPED